MECFFPNSFGKYLQFLAKQEDIDSYIVGGTDANLGEFPYQGLLQVEEETGSFQCGCALINSNWAITAAHCTDK